MSEYKLTYEKLDKEYSRVVKELTQERERRESAEVILKRFENLSDTKMYNLVDKHFKKYDSHQSENKD